MKTAQQKASLSGFSFSSILGSVLAGEDKQFLKLHPTAPGALTPADGQQHNLKARVATVPLCLHQRAQEACTGSFTGKKMVHRGHGDGKTWGIRHREAALDGEKNRRAAFKNKQSVNSVNALKLGQGGGTDRQVLL